MMKSQKSIILELKDVTRDFTQAGETINALKKTNLVVKEGEFIAIVGPSGSGKSTFLTIAGGLQNPSTGLVTVHGTDITKLSVHTLDIGLAGIEVYDILRDEYDIQIEFGDIGNILVILQADRHFALSHALIGSQAGQEIGAGIHIDHRRQHRNNDGVCRVYESF